MNLKLLFLKLYKNLLKYFFIAVYGRIYNSNKNLKKIHIDKVDFIDNINVKKYQYKIFTIDHGRVFTNLVENVSIIFKNHLIKEASFQQIKGKLSNNKNAVIKDGTPKILRKINGTTIVLSQGASGHFNYAHWLFDILPKLKIFSEIYNLNKIDNYYFSKLNSFQKETLKILNIDYKKFIDSNNYRHIKSNKLIAVSHPNYFRGTMFNAHSNMPDWIIFYLRKIFLKKKMKKYEYKKIFIDRSDSSQKHCKLINNQEVISFLESKKFKVLKLSEINFKDQIAIFFHSKVIIAPHGAGLANLTFCKKKTKVIEISPKNHGNQMYERISKINKLKHKFFFVELIKENKKGDMFIDINKLKKII